MDSEDIPIAWQPTQMFGREFEHVPPQIGAAASEAWACFSIGQYRSAVLMARAVVEATAKDRGATTGNLMAKIDKLYKEETIGKGIMEAAHEIRFMGNDMAHGDFVTDIDKADCTDVLTFLAELLNEVFQRPARLTAFQDQRAARKAQTEAANETTTLEG